MPGASTSRRSGPAQATATCPGDDFDWTTQLLSDTVDTSLIEVVRTDEFEMWLEKLEDLRGRARIIRRIDRLANGNPGDVRPIGNGLSELRLDVGPGYRVYYLQDADTLVLLLLCGGDKSTQQKDIQKAHDLAEEWRADRQKKAEGQP